MLQIISIVMLGEVECKGGLIFDCIRQNVCIPQHAFTTAVRTFPLKDRAQYFLVLARRQTRETIHGHYIGIAICRQS